MASSPNFGLSEEEANYRVLCSRLTLQSKKEGFFQQLADSLASHVNFGLFLCCENDVERFKVVAQGCWDHINTELIFRGKNSEVSIQKRLEGNKYFEKNDLKRALLCYCQSLVQAPVGPELASVYSNRSALLFKMGEYQQAIEDAELAISYGSPETSKHKLYERMTSCYISLKNYQKAKVTVRLAKHLTEKHDSSNEKLLKKIEKHNEVIAKALKDQEASPKQNKQSPKDAGQCDTALLPPLPDGISITSPNPIYPNCTKKMTVEYEDEQGRFAKATEKIMPGEVILHEEPFAACLHLEKMGSHCTNCFMRVKFIIPCETCSHVVFCSRKCRKEAEKYHQYECKVMALLMGSGMSVNSYLALRIVTMSSAETFKEIVHELECDPTKIVVDESTGKFYPKSYLNIYNLAGLEHLRDPMDFYERTLMAVFLTKCLRLNQYFQINIFKNPKPTEDEILVGSFILRNLQVLQFNSYEICEFLMETRTNYRNTKTSSVGLAIYPMASYFNHSCAPDVTRFFYGKTMIIQAIKGVPPSKAINDNYGPIFTKMERRIRQKKLLGRYWFSCDCQACEKNFPLLSQFPLEIIASENDVEEKKALKKLVALEKQYFDEGMKAMDRGKPYAAVELFKRYLEEYEALAETQLKEKFAQNPHKTTLLAQEGIKLCLCSLGSVYLIGEKQ